MPLSRRHLAIAAGLAGSGLGATLLLGDGRRRPAPRVTYTLLDGQQVSSDELLGQVVLVNFWATGCSACVAEMPKIQATFDTFRGRGYQTLAVAMSYDAPAQVASFAEARQLPFGVVIDNTGEIARRFGGVQLTPTSFLIDKHGAIVQRHVGAPDFTALQAMVARLLAEA